MVIITTKNITSDYKQILTQDIRSSLSEALEDIMAKDIIVNVESFDDACAAIDKQVKMLVNGTMVKPSDIKTYFKKQTFLFDIAKENKDVFQLEPTLKKAALNVAPSKMTEKEVLSLLNDIADTQAKKAVVQRTSTAFEERRAVIENNLNLIDEQITPVNASYKDGSTLSFIKENKGIHIINGQKGSGKTEVMIQLFKDDMEQGNFPLFVNSSRALSESMIDKELEGVFYKNIIANVDRESNDAVIKKGVLGVVNTVFMNEDLKLQRMRSRTLIVDEIEEVFNHMSGKAIGKGTLEDQADIFERFEALLNNVDNVVLTDAMFSRNTLEIIKRMNKKFKGIYLHSQESEHAKPVVRYMSEAMNMAETKATKEKKGVFCDGSHSEVKSKFNAVINALKGNEKTETIDAHFMSDREKAASLKDKKAFSASNDIIFYNSAAKCGLSIVDEDYTTTSLFACKTVSPNELVQASARLRCTKTVNLSFDAKGNRIQPLTPFSVLNKIMFEEMDLESITAEKHMELMKDEHVQNVVNRITYKNNLNNDYINTALILFEVLGYEVQYVANEEEKVKEGSRVRRAGNKEEKEMREANVMTAQHIDAEEAQKIKARGEHNSQENKNKLESFNIRAAYNVDTIDEELLKFDNAGRGRKVIKNLQLLRAKDKGPLNDEDVIFATMDQLHKIVDNKDFVRSEIEKDSDGLNGIKLNGTTQITKMMMDKLLETTGMTAEDFGQYSAHEAEAFQEFVTKGEVQISANKSIKASVAFKIAFPDCRICEKSPMKTVSGILKNMFNVKSPENTKVRKQGKYIYHARPEEKAEKYYKQSIA